MRWITRSFALSLLSVLVIACSASTGEEVSFTVIAEGDTAADYPDEQGIVISSPTDWQTLWEQIHRYSLPQPSLPEVDFTQHTLLAVFAGEKRSGGYGIRVEKMSRTDQTMIVHVIGTSPAPDEMTIALITYPYQIVKILDTHLPIRFDF